jgi:hypothetical protein
MSGDTRNIDIAELSSPPVLNSGLASG